MEGVVKIVLDKGRTGKAFDVEERTVEKFELVSGVVSPLGES